MSKKLRKPIGRLIAAIAVLALSLGVVVAGAGTAWAATGTITIHPPQGVQGTVTYTAYKIFDAEAQGTNARYTPVNDSWGVPDVEAQYTSSSAGQGARRFNPKYNDHFILDSANNVHYGVEQDDDPQNQSYSQITRSDGKEVWFKDSAATSLDSYTIAAIKKYVEDHKNDFTGSLIATASNPQGGDVSLTGVDDGYWYITTSVGTAVTINTNTPNAVVDDKSEVPSLDKTITQVSSTADGQADSSAGSVDSNGKNAIAQVGSYVTYQVRVDFGKDATNIKLHDQRGKGLAKASGSSLGVTFYKKGSDGAVADQVVSEPSDTARDSSSSPLWYTYREIENQSGLPDGADKHAEAGSTDVDDTMTMAFLDGIDKKADYAVVTYTLQVTSDALQTTPGQNTAKVTYGNDNTTTEQHTQVYNAKFSVVKRGSTGTGLAGAGFVLTRTTGSSDAQRTQYYKYTPANADQGTVASVAWVDDVDDATEYISSSDGKLYAVAVRDGIKSANTESGEKSFVGLANGTYTLVEHTIPRSYNKAEDYTFTVDGASANEALKEKNLVRSTTVINKQGSILPSTGGMGTTAFYVIGGVLIAGAVAYLVHRRKANAGA